MDGGATKRAHWESRVVRHPFSEAEEEADALFWDRIPLDERASATWELSKELDLLMASNAGENATQAAFQVERR
jgi:hypothetical protein